MTLQSHASISRIAVGSYQPSEIGDHTTYDIDRSSLKYVVSSPKAAMHF